jgi:hypothetical protein
VPVPFNVDQVIVDAEPPKVPFREIGVVPQVTWSTPAFTIAEGLIVTNNESMTEGQSPAGSLVVKNNQALPIAMSVGDNEYWVFPAVGKVKIPPFPPVQVTLDADPPKDPERFIVLVVEQIITSAPALTVGVELTETLLVVAVQPVEESVKVKVTFPDNSPVATPVAGITDAILGVLDTHVPTVDAVNCNVLPTHKVLAADKVGIV